MLEGDIERAAELAQEQPEVFLKLFGNALVTEEITEEGILLFAIDLAKEGVNVFAVMEDHPGVMRDYVSEAFDPSELVERFDLVVEEHHSSEPDC